MNLKSKVIEYFERTFINISSWILDKDSPILKDRRSSFSSEVTKEILQHEEKPKCQQYQSILSKLFLYLNKILKLALTMTFFGNKQVVIETNHSALSSAESRIENLNDITQALKKYASLAEEEHSAIASNVKEMKNQITTQAEILSRNMHEIENLKEEVNQADVNSAHQKKMIDDLENELKVQKENLSIAERKLKGIADQFLPQDSTDPVPESEKFGDDNYLLIIDQIQELKSKVQQQDNLLTKMQQIISGLDELSHVNKNIAKQSELINDFKNGLRRKSVHLLENLKSIAGQANTSFSFAESTKLEDFQDFDKSLSGIVQKTTVFLDEMNTKYEILENNKSLAKERDCNRFSDIWEQNSNLTLIKCSDKQNNSLITINKKEATSNCNIVTLNKETQTERINDPVDTSCQTDESCSKATLCNTIESLNSLRDKYEALKENLETCKSEKSKLEELLNTKINDFQIEILDQVNKYNERTKEISVLKEELQVYQNYKKENAKLKDLLETKNKENKTLKTDINKISSQNNTKNKEIATLKQALENMQISHGQYIETTERKSEVLYKEYITIKDKLAEAKDSNKNIQYSYKNSTEAFTQQLQSAQQTLLAKQNENTQLKIKLEALNKKLRDTKAEFEDTIQRKDNTIALYKNASKAKSAEIEFLKRELVGDAFKSSSNIESHKRAINFMQNFPNTKDNQGKVTNSSQVVLQKSRASATTHITFRDRYQD